MYGGIFIESDEYSVMKYYHCALSGGCGSVNVIAGWEMCDDHDEMKSDKWVVNRCKHA